jgi:HAD superfamily hydrolase (TIGR01549 family)
MVKPYKAVLFDLFNTVAMWQPDRLPPFEWRGKTLHSTIGILRQTVEEQVPEASFDAFLDALWAANDELSARRATDMKEIPSLERFTLTLTKIGYPEVEDTRRRARILSLKHMELLASAVEVPNTHVDFLGRISERYPLALVSNFDHGPTAREIVERDGVAGYFDPIVISDDHGWRKPHPSIFSDTLATLGVAADEALYVGDSAEDDVVGAKGAGLDIAWVNARGGELPAGIPAPDYVVAAIPALSDILLPD